MGASDRSFRPHITFNVEYVLKNHTTQPDDVLEIIKSIYLENPWIVDGVVRSLVGYTSKHKRGTRYGSFMIHTWLDEPVVSGSQQHAFEMIITEVAEKFCLTRDEWGVESFSFDLNLSYTAIECASYYSTVARTR